MKERDMSSKPKSDTTPSWFYDFIVTWGISFEEISVSLDSCIAGLWLFVSVFVFLWFNKKMSKPFPPAPTTCTVDPALQLSKSV